ncbi:MAG: IS1380 family transposase [Desulfobacterales bacterium]
MRTQRSRIGRRRKVFKQGKAHISFTGKAVTSSAGMALVSRALDAFSIRDQLKTIFPSLDKDQKYPTSTFFEQLVALRILGGDALSDAAILDDAAIKAMFGWDGVAHPTTFGRRLKALTWHHNLALESIVTGLSQRVTTPGRQFVAIDSTVATVFGQQIEGAERGYNPHKPGRNSYHPLLAVDVGSRSVVDGYLRPGSCASNDGLDGFIRKIVAEANRPGEEIVFRLDKGLTSGAALDTIEELKAGYVGKVKLTSTVMGHISRVKNWRSIGSGCFAANFHCQLDGWSHPRRFVVIERHLEPEKPCEQLSMFDMLEGRYEVMVTNQRLNAENIWRLYNRGAVVEQVIEEIKNDYAATGIRTNEFWANDALFQTGLIAYNLLNCIRRLTLPKGLRTARIKRIGLLLLHMPANVVCRSRQLLIKIKRDHPFRLIFYQAMKALA